MCNLQPSLYYTGYVCYCCFIRLVHFLCDPQGGVLCTFETGFFGQLNNINHGFLILAGLD